MVNSFLLVRINLAKPSITDPFAFPSNWPMVAEEYWLQILAPKPLPNCFWFFVSTFLFFFFFCFFHRPRDEQDFVRKSSFGWRTRTMSGQSMIFLFLPYKIVHFYYLLINTVYGFVLLLLLYIYFLPGLVFCFFFISSWFYIVTLILFILSLNP